MRIRYLLLLMSFTGVLAATAQSTEKPPLHGNHWMAVTGKPLALIYNPKTGKVIAINALGWAPTGATPAFFKGKGYSFPPEYGPLAAVTPGTPGGLCYMLAEYGTMSLKEVLAPAMEMAKGYAIEAQTANSFESQKKRLKDWPYSKALFLVH